MLTFGTTALAVVAALVVSYVAASPTFGWTGRSLSLLDPTYASKYIPIIASVSGEQRGWLEGGSAAVGWWLERKSAAVGWCVILPSLYPHHRLRVWAAACLLVWTCSAEPRLPPPEFAEHQPPSWSSYFTDLHIASLLAPAGLLLCFHPLTDASLFLLLYGVTAVYFSGVMVRACSG